VTELTCLEICAGAGGQSFGLEQAGFAHWAAIELDTDACETLRLNRPEWDVIEKDVHKLDGREYEGVDLFAGGVPCPPFSIAGKQLGADDERDLFPQALRLIAECEPEAVMLENVKGLASARFAPYRQDVIGQLTELGYKHHWQVLNASEFGVPQLRPRFILVALKPEVDEHFSWPAAQDTPPLVGAVLHDLMASEGWELADEWAERACGIAPTLVGGSRKHGGPDLGPTRARADWLRLAVDGRALANRPPHPGEHQDLDRDPPRLTLEMTARIQGFSDEWRFSGRKTAAYRQIGNAFPPPVAAAVGSSIAEAIKASRATAYPVRRLHAV
jgi:DNA (cytosine-5)-methyltransferase 1